MRAAALLVAAAGALAAQNFTERGFLEGTGTVYPQTAPNDSAHLTGEALLRWEAFYKAAPWLRLASALDARFDTHRQVAREAGLAWWDRDRLRPALAVRRLSATITRGRLTVELGKQFVRWGKADVLNPTDRFAPRDFLTVVDNDFLAVTAARATYGTQANTIEVVFTPRLTPSRIPLLNQRWAVLPSDLPVGELAPAFPGRAQVGARWNHVASAGEFSLSYYDGFDHLPLFQPFVQTAPLRVGLQRYYPRLRSYGGDAAVPTRWVTLKAEAAWFTSATLQADEYVLYVVQAERQAGEWFFIGGYAGQAITTRRAALDFSPVRGFTSAFVARAGYTIDTNRSLAFETVARRNGKGLWAKLEYSHAFGQHWRATAGVALIRGSESDFLGQYRRNSHGILALRYSF